MLGLIQPAFSPFYLECGDATLADSGTPYPEISGFKDAIYGGRGVVRDGKIITSANKWGSFLY